MIEIECEVINTPCSWSFLGTTDEEESLNNIKGLTFKYPLRIAHERRQWKLSFTACIFLLLL